MKFTFFHGMVLQKKVFTAGKYHNILPSNNKIEPQYDEIVEKLGIKKSFHKFLVAFEVKIKF